MFDNPSKYAEIIKPIELSTQRPPCSHGSLAHSSTSVQDCPEPTKPVTHVHTCSPGPMCEQFALVSQSASPAAHGMISVWHTAPSQPGAHTHVYDALPSMQTPPFWHGIDAHSSTFWPQVSPAKPTAHEHKYESTAIVALPVESAHVALCRHGADRHSSMSTLHVDPDQPAAHVHENASTPSTQTPPFEHGVLAHSFTSTSQLPLCALFVLLSDTLHSDLYTEIKL